MKKAYFVKVSDGFEFAGFYSEQEKSDCQFKLYSDDDLYKLIDAAKDALNNIPLNT